MSHDASQLMKILHTVNSLVYNKSLFMEVQPFVSIPDENFSRSYFFLLHSDQALHSDRHWTVVDS